MSFQGVLVARSGNLVLPGNDLWKNFLLFETADGSRVKVISSDVKLPLDFTCGSVYQVENLELYIMQDFEEFFWILTNAEDIRKEDDIQKVEIMENEESSRDGSVFSNLCGRITAIGNFSMYEINHTDTLVLAYYQQHCPHPKLKIGDEVRVTNAHRLIDAGGKVYYVLCTRGHLESDGWVQTSDAPLTDHSIFSSYFYGYGLNIEWLIWMKDALNQAKECVDLTALKLSDEKTDKVYADLVLHLLNKKKRITYPADLKMKIPILEFFCDKHECVPMRKLNTDLPCAVMSLQQFLARSAAECLDVEHTPDYTFNIFKDINQPLLSYVGVSKKTQQITVQGSTVEVPLVLSKEESNSETQVSSFLEKIVLINLPVVVKECFLDPRPGFRKNVISKSFYYVVTNSTNVQVLGSVDLSGFSNCNEISTEDSLSIEHSNSLGNDGRKSTPIGDEFSTDSIARLLVTHKTAEIGTPVNHMYVLVQNDPNSETSLQNVIPKSGVFLRIGERHAEMFHVIYAPCVLELRLRNQTVAAFFRQTCLEIPNTVGLKDMISTRKYLSVPPEADLDIFSTPVELNSLSVAQACNETTPKKQFVRLEGIIKQRYHQNEKYGRAPGRAPSVKNNRNFGLPGEREVIILKLLDMADGTSTTVFLSWPNSNLYPLALIPGATVRLHGVYKTGNPPYFRGTNLTSVELISLPGETNDGNVSPSNQPQDIPSSNQPQDTPISNQPQDTPSSNQPQVTPSSNQPQDTLSSNQPQDTPSSNQPQDTPRSNQPQDTPSSNQPQDTLSSNQPQDTPSSNQPQDTLSSNQPQDTLSSNQPQDTPSSNQPQDTPSSNQPQVTPSSNQLQDTPSSNQPQDTPRSNQPQDTPSSNQPQDTPSSNQPQDTPSSNQPQDTLSSNQPQDTQSSNQPQDTPSSNQPQGSPSSNQLQDTPSSNQPQDTPSSNQPQDTLSSNQPQDTPSSNQPQDTPSSNQPQGSPSSNQPQDTLSSIQPNIRSTNTWKLFHQLKEGEAANCYLSDLHLLRVEIKLFCSRCEKPFAEVKCTSPGCSEINFKIKATACVAVEAFDEKATMYVSDSNVKRLLNLKDDQWQLLLRLVIENKGSVVYYGKNTLTDRSLWTRIFGRVCLGRLRGVKFHGLVQRDKSYGNNDRGTLECIQLSKPREAVALRGIDE